MRTRYSRALLLAASSLIGCIVLLAPVTSSAQTAAPSAGFAYGFQVHLWHFDPVARANVIGDVKQTGFNWMTEQIEWQSVETDVGQYDWTELDKIVGDGTAAGLRIMLSFAHAPAFYRSDTSGLMPADPSTFGQFMQAVATRYTDKIQAYELWNEENLDREAGLGNVDPATFLPIQEAGYTGVKAGDPNAMVLLGAPSPTGANIPGSVIDDISYLQQLYAINSGEVIGYFDALSAHPSGFSNPPDCTPATPQCSLSGAYNTDDSFFAFTRVNQYRDIMVQNGDAAKQIWFTEFGYCSNPLPPEGYDYCKYITEDQQAQFLVQAYNMARQLPYVGGMFQWNLNFQMSVPQSDEKWGFGIVRADYSGRPAYGALLGMPKL
ncbi:MAG: glycoside hydrolase family protein [Chloroflexi bacterium]|nr:glycoside hydrolase family protein [Chloroflexota bacterium]